MRTGVAALLPPSYDPLAPAQYDPARACAQAFARFDGGSKGYLTRHELRCAHIALLGHPPSLVCCPALLCAHALWTLGAFGVRLFFSRHIDCMISSAMLEYAEPMRALLSVFRAVLVVVYVVLVARALAQVELDAWLPPQRDDDTGLDGAVVPPGGVTLAQLSELIARKLAVQEPEEVVRRAFRAFDGRAKGYIGLADLEAAVERVAPGLPRATVALAFSELDTDGDGRVGYGDFYHMFCARPGSRPTAVAARAGAGPLRPAPGPPAAGSVTPSGSLLRAAAVAGGVA